MSESKTKKERPLIQTIGLILLAILALGVWYISIPAFLIWYLWVKTKLSKKAKIIITAVPSVIIGGAVIWALAWGVIQGINSPTVSIISPNTNKLDVYEDKIDIKAKVSNFNKILLSNKEITAQNNLVQEVVTLNPGKNEILLAVYNSKVTEPTIAKVEVNYITPEMKKELEAKAELEKAKLAEDAKKQQEDQAAKARTELIEKQFSGWDGSNFKLTKLIKAGMNDPGSYEHVSTQYWDQGDHLIINTTFRGKNAFGGVVTSTVKVKSSIDGESMEVIEQYP